MEGPEVAEGSGDRRLSPWRLAVGLWAVGCCALAAGEAESTKAKPLLAGCLEAENHTSGGWGAVGSSAGWVHGGVVLAVRNSTSVAKFEFSHPDLGDGLYDLRIYGFSGLEAVATPKEPRTLAVSWDGKLFAEHTPNRQHYFDIKGRRLTGHALRFWVRRGSKVEGTGYFDCVRFVRSGHPHPDVRREGVIYSLEDLARKAVVLRRIEGFEQRLAAGATVDWRQLDAMLAKVARWAADHQVAKAGRFRGAVHYPSELRHSFRESALASVVFMQQHVRTRDAAWRKAARAAADYALSGVRPDGAVFDFIARKPRNELVGENELRDCGDGVETPAVADALIAACELGLEPSKPLVRAVERMADYVLSKEAEPGVFAYYGPEGFHDTTYLNALSALCLTRAYHFLAAHRRAKQAWLDAAARGVSHILDAQLAEGLFPYSYYNGFGREQERVGVVDHSLVVWSLGIVSRYPPFAGDARLRAAIRRAGGWYAHVLEAHILSNGKVADVDIDWRKAGFDFRFYTWGYFVVGRALAEVWRFDKGNRLWPSLAFGLAEHVRSSLWRGDATTPFRPAVLAIEVGMRPHRNAGFIAWLDTSCWNARLLRETADIFEGW